MGDLFIKNVTIATPLGSKAVKGDDMRHLHIVKDGCIVIQSGMIRYAGAMSELPSEYKVEKLPVYDGGGVVALPGFVDSHTHLIFGGYRPDEFQWRLNGDSYMSIMERGGGIQSTVDATRIESEDSLLEKAKWFVDRMTAMGVTTVEAKSGYGLDTESELKMLRVIDRLRKDMAGQMDVVATFLGAHAVPREYKGRTDEYIDLMIKEMLPAARPYAEFCDIFTEKNVFEIEESRRFMRAARDAGFKLKFHADEIVTLGGAELAAELGALSADHLLHVSDQGVKDMAEKDVVATLLPLTAFALREPYAPARKFIEAGCAVALATDLNPGSCFSGSIPLTIALACIYMQMTVEETITALTINGAAAVGRADSVGSLEAGKRGDVVLLHFDNYNSLPYYVGMNCVRSVIKDGKIVSEEKSGC